MYNTATMIISSGLSDHRTGFSFEREAGFPYWTMGLNFTGQILGRSGGATYISQPHSLGIIQPNTPYRNQLAPGCIRHTSVWFVFTPREEWLPLLDYPQLAKGYIRLDMSGFKQRLQIRGHFQKAHTLFQAKERQASVRAMHALEAGFLLAYDSYTTQREDDVDQRILRAAEHISTHVTENISVDRLAALAHLSPSRFAHLFKDKMGVSPMAYHEQQRMQQARALIIAQEYNVQEIAEQLGYDNSFYFSKRFKIYHGLAPKFFQKRIYEAGFLEQFEMFEH